MSIAIIYNYIFIIGRTVFWDMQNVSPVLWIVLDYLCDFIFIVDIFIHAHEGIDLELACLFLI